MMHDSRGTTQLAGPKPAPPSGSNKPYALTQPARSPLLANGVGGAQLGRDGMCRRCLPGFHPPRLSGRPACGIRLRHCFYLFSLGQYSTPAALCQGKEGVARPARRSEKKDALRLRPEGIFYEVCLFVRAAQTRGCGSDILRSGRSITEVPMAKHTVLTELVGTVSGGNGPVKKGVHWVWLAISNS